MGEMYKNEKKQDKFQKNVDHNICAQTWHSMLVLGHNQNFEISSPVIWKDNVDASVKNKTLNSLLN